MVEKLEFGSNLKLHSEIFEAIKNNDDIEIKPLDKDLIHKFLQINDSLEDLEHHDKIALASAIQLECPIITNDPKIINYITKANLPNKVLF